MYFCIQSNFLFHFSKKEYSDFIFYMSWKIPIKKHTLQSRNASDLCLVKCFKIFHMNYLGFHILKRFANSFHPRHKHFISEE